MCIERQHSRRRPECADAQRILRRAREQELAPCLAMVHRAVPEILLQKSRTQDIYL